MNGYIELNPSSFFAAVIVRNDSSRVLSRLGHDHVVRALPEASRLELSTAPLEAMSFELHFAADRLVVDDAPDRSRVGLGAPVSDKDRRATADNMLSKGQLDAGRFPRLSFACRGVQPGSPATLLASLTIRGHQHAFDFPLDLHVDQTRIEARGQVELTHADLGLKPYRAPMGALQNRPELTFVVELSADLHPLS
ncbi:hypothetical protein DL240_01095 [Lujinxingia litoralis]|uniref:Lipid/polyisoprenoid-binding YceI-like domain-containing protein n=1 Tax=Lujinxingia litoralis TaxID=2211119 RepID=A0A328CA65_9DELT|nr:YceI family protein [Lujinxingia litoralis]RAL24838.1 hypothetical protein DL240_01095 [Lujinxingia litoralis]